MTKHTPTPWEVTGEKYEINKDGKKQFVRQICADVFQIAMVNAGTPQSEANNMKWFREECEANAKHIVHCVNNFDALLDALKELLDSKVYADAEGMIYIKDGGCDDQDHRVIVKKCEQVIKQCEVSND